MNLYPFSTHKEHIFMEIEEIVLINQMVGQIYIIFVNMETKNLFDYLNHDICLLGNLT